MLLKKDNVTMYEYYQRSFIWMVTLQYLVHRLESQKHLTSLRHSLLSIVDIVEFCMKSVVFYY